MDRFHYENGWYFSRLPNGDVCIENGYLPVHGHRGVIKLIIDSDSWISIITAVSHGGSVAENYQKAEEFHEGRSEDVKTMVK